MAQHNITGNIGEQLAATYLKQNDYTILHQNWRHSRWEVDIIAEKNGVLHFIEIKTRRSLYMGLPEERVTSKKIKHLLGAAEEFVYQHPQWERIQLDILSILMIKDQPVEYFLIEDVSL